MTANTPSLPPARAGLLVLGILLIASNLRAPVTSVAPVLDLIRADFAFSATAAGLLTTLPLLAFAALSPLAGPLARRCGMERTLLLSLLALGAGLLIRSAGAEWALFAGTLLIGAAIAIGNVLLPSLLKRDFPDHIASLTSAYVLVMGIAAGLGSVLAVPLAQWSSGWALSLLFPVVLALAGLLAWLPQWRRHTAPVPAATTAVQETPLWRNALAWQVTLFLGLNSLVYYVVVGWLPSMLRDAGLPPAAAGSMHGLLQVASALPGLLLVPVIRRLHDQRLLAVATSTLSTVGLLGLLLAPHWSVLWTLMYGMGAGATIILGLAFVSLRACSVRQAAALSGMAQAVGYLLAAAGPMLVGLLRDLSGGWTVALLLCVLVSLLQAASGFLAGRNIQLD